MLFWDETNCLREGIFNTHYEHMWVLINPYSACPRVPQQRFTVSVWESPRAQFFRPYILPLRLDWQVSLFSAGYTSKNAYRCPRTCLAKYVISTGWRAILLWKVRRDHLNRTFSIRYFFLSGAMKSFVYDAPLNSKMVWAARIYIAAVTIRETPGTFEHVRQSKSHRCRECIHANGCNFVHLLW